MAHKALRVFLGADLRMGHHGLAAVAKKERILVKDLCPGEFVIFINSEKNRIKLYTANNVVAYLKLDHGKIEMRTLALIPQAFQATGRIDYDKVLREVLEEALIKQKTVRVCEEVH